MPPSHSNILVIATRQIGDVLLTTPMIRSLRRGYPEAQLEVLVYDNTDGILEGNPDIDKIITIPEHPGKVEYLSIIKNIFRNYDLIVSAQGTDRAMIYALFAGNNKRVGIIQSLRSKERWKQWLLDQWILLDNIETHTVIQNLKLIDLLQLPRHNKVVPPRADDASFTGFYQSLPFSIEASPFVILHPFPRFRYKDWQFGGWMEVIRYLLSTDTKVILSGGPGREEYEFCRSLAAIADSENIISIVGSTSLAILARLISEADAYVGPDTAVTHLAAATGTKTITLYGPTNPMKWGPWPVNCEQNTGSPYQKKQARQESDNVIILQGLGNCVPCFEEGCDRHKESSSRCLQTFQAQRIIDELRKV